MHNKLLADKVRYFKETEGGREQMCKVMEDMRNEAAWKKSVEIAFAMIEDSKLSLELIAKYSGLTLEEVEELARKKSA